jgi:porin
MGAVVVHRGSPITLTAMVFDPEDRTGDYGVKGLFGTGVNLSVGATWSGRMGGRATSIGLTSAVSTKRGQDMGDILLPPDLASSTRQGSYNIAVSASHMLVESAARKGQGLSLNLKAAIGDGNPNVIQSSVVAGIAGHGMVAGRPHDSFGIGGFFYNFSNVLQSTVQPVLNFRDEVGVEAWYSLAITPWLKVTADAQLVDPARGDRPTALIGGLRTNIAF